MGRRKASRYLGTTHHSFAYVEIQVRSEIFGLGQTFKKLIYELWGKQNDENENAEIKCSRSNETVGKKIPKYHWKPYLKSCNWLTREGGNWDHFTVIRGNTKTGTEI